jgi:hypothetical protein
MKRRYSAFLFLDLILFSGIANAQNPLFSAPVNYPAGFLPSSVFAADLNGDGNNDLAVADLGSENISILLGNGDGTFQ